MTLEDLKKIIQDKYLHDSGFRCKICKNVHHGAFKLSSGEKSDKYFDIKGLVCSYNDSTYLFKEFNKFLDDNWKLKQAFKTYGGLELGGIPIATVLNGMYGKTCCFIRKSEREHGLKKTIEGNPVSPILLVDDVLSSGNTVYNAISTVYNQGHNVSGILCVINRMDENTLEWIDTDLNKTTVFQVYSLFKESDFE